MISDEAVDAAAKAMWEASQISSRHNTWEFLKDGGNFQTRFRQQARTALEAAAPYMPAALVSDLDEWAGRSKSGFYDEAQDDVVQILNPYRSQA